MTQEREQIPPGIYFGMPEDQYHAAAGLSCSGMKHLAVSPLQFWHKHINPTREPEAETPARRFGKAAHCLGLEPQRFAERYALRLSSDDYPGALVTTDDMKAWLEQHGMPKSAKKKADLIDRIIGSGLDHPPIWDLELARHAELNQGKTLLGEDESTLIQRAAAVIADDPYARSALTGGMAEVSFFVRDPETGVMLKARMDYVKPAATLDLKTFSNSRNKPFERAINEAIYYEWYYVQCVFYHTVREIGRQSLAAGEISVHGNCPEAWLKGFVENDRHSFGLVFIESDEPFHLDIVQLRRAEASGGSANVYWSFAEIIIADMKALYAECVAKYGDRRWCEPRQPRVLFDTDIPQLLFTT